MWTKIKDNLTLICTIVIVSIVFWFGRSCGKQINHVLEPSIITITKYRDTIFPKDTIISFKEKKVFYPVYDKRYDTIYIQKPIDSLELHRFFVYNDSTEDSNIKIYSKIVTQGKTLSSFKPSYKLKVPLIIKDCTIVKKDSLIYKPYKYEIHTGVIVSTKNIIPTVDLSIDKCTYSIGYDPFNKQPIIGFKYRLIGWTHRKRK